MSHDNGRANIDIFNRQHHSDMINAMKEYMIQKCGAIQRWTQRQDKGDEWLVDVYGFEQLTA